MNRQDDHLGDQTLRLLGRRWTATVLRELAGSRALQPSDLERRLDIAHSALLRRLDQLVSAGAVRRERVAGVPPRAYYALTDAGQALLPICDAAAQWESRWSPSVPASDPALR
jgi:DNA-binding HxlR family transcriptional regulator